MRIKDEISTCTTSMEEQMHLRRQLEHMIRRLQTSQLRVDAHVLSMSKAVDSSLEEADEVKLLCRQLEAGKSRAVQFLQEYDACVALIFVQLSHRSMCFWIESSSSFSRSERLARENLGTMKCERKMPTKWRPGACSEFKSARNWSLSCVEIYRLRKKRVCFDVLKAASVRMRRCMRQT